MVQSYELGAIMALSVRYPCIRVVLVDRAFYAITNSFSAVIFPEAYSFYMTVTSLPCPLVHALYETRNWLSAESH